MSGADELRHVMREIIEAMGGRGAVLTLHPEDDAPVRVLHHDDGGDISEQTMQDLITALGQIGRDEISRSLRWVEGGHQDGIQTIFCMPVQAIDRHSQLIVSVFFEGLTRRQRESVEAVYLRRRPFAIGYFRLWQLNQIRKHRIAGLEAALGFFEIGIVLLDRAGRIVFINPAASALVDAHDGLRRHDSRLVATDLQSGVRLHAAIGHVIAESATESPARRVPLMTLERPEGHALVVSVFPTVHPATEPTDVAAIVYIVDPAIDTDRMLQPICRLHQLSPLQTRLVCLLTAGATLGEAAARMKVKEQTVRGSLKQIFMKTGTHRQADLVRVMLTSIVRTRAAFLPEVI